MTPSILREQLSSGVISFPVTPFHADYSLDLEGYKKNVAELAEHPLAAIIAPGGTGEVFSLTLEEHLAIVQATLEVVGGRVPVLAGAGFNQPLAVQMAKQADEAGVDGILAFPPYYPNADFDGMGSYYAAIAEATSKGLLIYSRDWFNPPADVVTRLTQIPNLIAWKDGTGDTRRCQQLMQQVGDRLLWIGGAGDDQAPAYYSIGMRTYTSSIATVSPKLSLRLHELASAGGGAALTQLMNDYVVPLYAMRARRRGYEVSVMKEMMSQLGKPAGPVRPPLVDVKPGEKDEIRRMLEHWKPVLQG